jgi:hypothetical protein
MVDKAIIRILDSNEDDIKVMFNPNEYTISTSADMGYKDGKEKNTDAIPFFNKVNVADFTVKLIFDTYEKHGNTPAGTDVRTLTKRIAKLVTPFVAGTVKKKPPVCLFIWGSFTYRGVIHKLDQKFTLFLPTGIPVRAELMVTFKYVTTPQKDAKDKGIEACRKLWIVKKGDRLDIIAHLMLKDPHLWRKIADENNIDNPLAFPEEDDIGRKLKIPD